MATAQWQIILQVLVTHDKDGFFAQGIEVDYAAQGKTLEGVKKNFEDGFKATVIEHIKAYGTPKYFFARKASPDAIGELLGLMEAKKVAVPTSKPFEINGVSAPMSLEYVGAEA